MPDHATFAKLIQLIDENNIRLLSDEVYRGIEQDPDRTLVQAADLSERGLSLNVMSKAYGLPGLRIGWIACRDTRCWSGSSAPNTTGRSATPARASYWRKLRCAQGRPFSSETGRWFARTWCCSTPFSASAPSCSSGLTPRRLRVLPAVPRLRRCRAFLRRVAEARGVLLLPPISMPLSLGRLPPTGFGSGWAGAIRAPRLDGLRRYLTHA